MTLTGPSLRVKCFSHLKFYGVLSVEVATNDNLNLEGNANMH